jgi:hypothetical protein
MRQLVDYWPILKREMYASLGLSEDGKVASNQGLLGPNIERFRTAFEALRLLNIEFLSRCCARVSKMMMRSEQELGDNAKRLEQAVRTLMRPVLDSAA